MKPLKLFVLSIFLLSLIACSGNGPSNSIVKEKVLESFVRTPDSVSFDYIKCEPKPPRKYKGYKKNVEYKCIVSLSVEAYGESDVVTRSFDFEKSNDMWFADGPSEVSREEEDIAQKRWLF